MTFDFPRAAVVIGLLFSAWIIQVNGQQNSFTAQVSKAYGPNQELVNGLQYYNKHALVQGHPYFLDENFVSGSVIINGQEFSNVRIRYDIYSQHLQLEYESFSGASNSLVTVNDHLESFMNGDYWFKKLDLNGEEKFFQVIETEQFSCYVYWKKTLERVNYSNFYGEQFTDVNPRYLIKVNGDIREFKNRKTFAGSFHESLQKEIRRFLRQKRFVFRKAAPGEIVRNMHAVSNLLNSRISP